MQTAFYVCRNCHSEFEMMLIPKVAISCLVCESLQVKERKNAKINCTSCCSGCDQVKVCEAWND